MATLRVGDGETVTLGGGTQLAVVEDGQCYLIDLSPSGETISMTPTPVIFRNIDSEEDGGDEESQDEAITLQYFSSNPNDSEGHQIYLDDEQARAVANLLEFHNQQTSPTVSISSSSSSNSVVLGNNGLVSKSSPSTSSSVNHLTSTHNEVQPHFVSMDIDPLRTDVLVKKPPLRTYSKRARYYEEKSFVQTSNQNHISSENKSLPGDVNSHGKYILPNSMEYSPRKKRRLFTDAVKVIPTSEFRQQLLDTSDIVQKKIDCAPPTKKAMYFLTYGGVGKFFAYPGRKIMSVPLSKLFFSRLTMITETKSYPNVISKKLEPLNPDLSTPIPSKAEQIEEMQSRCTHQASHIFNDAAAKRTANSFDYFCKGMTKPPKYEYRRKSSKSNISTPESSPLKTPIKQPLNIVKEELVKNEVESQQPVSMDIGTHTLVASSCDTEGNGDFVYTIQDSSIIRKLENNSDQNTTELFLEEENQEQAGGPSNFDMLIAAAEQHNNLPPPADVESSIDAEIKEEDVAEDSNKSEVVYCTNESMEQLIVVGANGERYRVTASNQGELTLWPEADCDPSMLG